jgi:hypothetical protein
MLPAFLVVGEVAPSWGPSEIQSGCYGAATGRCSFCYLDKGCVLDRAGCYCILVHHDKLPGSHRTVIHHTMDLDTATHYTTAFHNIHPYHEPLQSMLLR